MVNIRHKLVNHTNTGSNNAIKLLPHLQKEGHSVLESKCPQKKSSSSKLQSISSPLASRWHSVLINHLAGSPSLPCWHSRPSELQTLIFPAFPPALLLLLLRSHFSRVQLCVALWTVAHQAPLSAEYSGQEYWSGLTCPPPGDLLNSGIEPGSSALRSDSLPLSHREAFPCCYRISNTHPAVTETSLLASITSTPKVLPPELLSFNLF